MVRKYKNCLKTLIYTVVFYKSDLLTVVQITKFHYLTRIILRFLHVLSR
jgi:hypothetical protein